MTTDQLNAQLNSNQPVPARAAIVFHTRHRPWAVQIAQALRRKFGLSVWFFGKVTSYWFVVVHESDRNRAQRMLKSIW